MAGDQNDFVSRLRAVLPRWWPDPVAAPVYNALLQGMAASLAQVYGLLAYVRLQTRLLSSTDGWLDLSAYSFFGPGLPRKAGEMDAPYRSRIMAALFPEKATRTAMVRALTALTGRAPIIVEPARAADVFCLGHSGLGSGQLGSYQMPYQAFVTVFRPASMGGAGIAGLGSSYAGLGAAYLALPDAASLYGALADADIFAAINATKPEGTTVWTRITS